MEQFIHLCSQTDIPDFHTRICPQILECGKNLLKSLHDLKQKKSILTKLIYLFPTEYIFFYEMAICYNNSIDEQLLWHKLCYNIKPTYFDNLLCLCRLLFSKGNYKEIIQLNTNDYFEKYFDNREFLHYYFYSLKMTTNGKNLVKYALKIVSSIAHIKCITHEEKFEKVKNYSNLAASYYTIGDTENTMKHNLKALELATKFSLHKDALESFQINLGLYDYCYYNHEELYNTYCKINTYYPQNVEWNHPQKHTNDGLLPTTQTPNQTPRKIRIGYVSSDFKTIHAVGNFILPILKNHNKNTFEIYLFMNQETIEPIFEQLTTRNLKIINMTDKDVAAHIYHNKIDILIDLNGNTTCNRLGIFAYSPAPIQITYLGFPNTTGLKQIQYRITDTIADNSTTKQLYTEQLIRLPCCFLLYQPIIQKNKSTPLITNPKEIILGSLNKELKNTTFVLDAWRQILHDAPNTKLVIKLETYDNIDARADFYMKQLDVERNRLILFTKTHDLAYYQLFSQVDILLDTFPYSGTTTTCHALYNSLPVVTLYNNDYHSHNVSSSILIHAGLPELVTYSVNDYIEKVKELISHPDKIDEYKKTIHNKFITLMNPTPFMTEYEDTLCRLYTEKFHL